MPVEAGSIPQTEATREVAPQKVVDRGEELPIKKKEANIKKALFESDRVIVVGQTGSGKTTLLPQFIYDVVSSKDPTAKILVTQPRRFAARSLATYVGSQFGQDLVGYRYKGANTITEKTKIGFVVDGSLVNALVEDPALKNYAAVMVDEVHEATIDIHLELALLKKAQEIRKKVGLPPLKIVLASATVDKEKLEKYFEGSIAFDIEGRLFEIKDHFSDHKIEPEDIPAEAASMAYGILKETQKVEEKQGDILIFMPGRSDIDETMKSLQTIISQANDLAGFENIEIIGITGGEQDKGQQDRITAENGKRKVIIATNVAQTSITIPKLQYVIDSGLVKINTYDESTGLSSLRLVEHTKADWQQRRGRAGRVGFGDCYNLFTKEQFNSRSDFQGSEIQRADLSALVLRMKSIGIEDIEGFDFMDHPSKDSIRLAVESLQKLGALDKDEKITTTGKEMSEFPLDPHFARMLVEAKNRGCVEEVSLLIGFLSNRKGVFAYNPRDVDFDTKYKRFINPDSDFMTLLNVWNEYVGIPRDQRQLWLAKNGFSGSVLFEVATTKNELINEESFEDLHIDYKNKAVNISDTETALNIKKSIITGFLDKVLLRTGNRYSLESGRKKGIEIDRSSVFAKNFVNMLVSGNIRSHEKRTHASMNERVTRDLIKEVAPYLENINQTEEEIEKDQQIVASQAIAEAQAIISQKKTSQIESPKETIKENKSLIERIKKAYMDILSRIKKFLHIK